MKEQTMPYATDVDVRQELEAAILAAEAALAAWNHLPKNPGAVADEADVRFRSAVVALHTRAGNVLHYCAAWL